MVNFFILSGETSGDNLAGSIVKELKKNNEKISFNFNGVGGKKLEKEGVKSLFSIKDISVMGFFEVIPNIFKILNRINFVVNTILKTKPDIIFTIDSPDFCFRVLEKIKKKDKNYFNNVKKIHLIAPSVWAYREKRAKKVAKLYDLLLCILPFEGVYFEKYGLKTKFVGHPIFDNYKKYENDKKDNLLLSSNDVNIVLTPGSRENEIRKIYPIMIKTIDMLKNKFVNKNLHVFTFVNNYTNDIIKSIAEKYNFDTNIILNEEKKIEILSNTNIGLAKSGTNVFEFNMANVPVVVIYTFNVLTNFLIKKIVKIKFANLVNIIAKKEIIPEFVLDKAKPNLIVDKIYNILSHNNEAQKQLDETNNVIKILGYKSETTSVKKIVNEIIKLFI